MNFFFCSEHYEPRIGGVTTYINQTCKALVKLGHQVSLGVLGESNVGSISIKEEPINGFKVIEFGTGLDSLKGNIPPNVRVNFAKKVESYLKEDKRYETYDAIHCFFGMYFMKYFNTDFFQKNGILLGVTIHNVPPEECGVSWKGDSFISYYKDSIKKELIRIVNKERIQKQDFDIYVVPSQIVKTKLGSYIDKNKIKVIGHGTTNEGSIAKEKDKSHYQILTVGGLVPHKNQHLIPKIANNLKDKSNAKFTWNIVGPNRNDRYVNHIKDLIKKYDIGDVVKLNISVPYDTLINLYKDAIIYVQLSSEEGFCLTALDAALFGIPIIGTKAGAIPEIIEDSMGTLVEIDINDITSGIIEWMEKSKVLSPTEISNSIQRVSNKYRWSISAKKLADIYKKIKENN